MKRIIHASKLILVLSLALAGRLQAITLSEALDDPNLVWTTSPNGPTTRPWIATNQIPHDGVDEAISDSRFQPNTDCWLETTVVGPGTISFYWLVSCEDPIYINELGYYEYYDYLDFKIGAGLNPDWDLIDPVERIAGNNNWQFRSFAVPPGTNTLQWIYRKDGSENGYVDRARLDEVSYVQTLLPPEITADPTNLTVAIGDSATFYVTATGTDPLAYQWYKGSSPLPNMTNASLVLPSVTTNDAGGYFVIVTNSVDSATSAVATLTVIKATPNITAWPSASSITYGQSLTSSILSGGTASVAGSFAFENTSLVPDAGNYAASVVFAPSDTGNYNSVTGQVNVSIQKAPATVTLGSLSQVYDGSARVATATTAPSSLPVVFTYDGSPNPPTNAGSYTVVGAINHSNYVGSATNTLVVSKANADVAINGLTQVYDGTARQVGATTTPLGLPVVFTYDGVASAPTNASSYTVVGTINHSNYVGSATNTLVVDKASALVELSDLSQAFDGSPKAVTPTTTPMDLTLDVTYDGSPSTPSAIGFYTVIATVVEPNYQGATTNTLEIYAEPPVIITQPTNISAVVGETVAFQVEATSTTAPLTYEWRKGESVVGASSTLSFSPVAVGDAGDYSVVISNPYSSVTGDVVTLTVDLPPVLTISQQAGNVVLSWPESAVGFVPYAAGDMGMPIWEQVGAGLVTNLGQVLVTLPATNSQQYFRLQKP